MFPLTSINFDASTLFCPRSAPSDAQPTEAETAVWNQVSAVLEEAHGILAELQSYNGAGQEIREVRTLFLICKGLEIYNSFYE